MKEVVKNIGSFSIVGDELRIIVSLCGGSREYEFLFSKLQQELMISAGIISTSELHDKYIMYNEVQEREFSKATFLKIAKILRLCVRDYMKLGYDGQRIRFCRLVVGDMVMHDSYWDSYIV
jgi:hypothetical protein